MGVTIGKDIGAYDDVEPVDPDDPPEPYSEEGTVTSGVERSDFTGTLDTTDVAAGEHSDLRNVSTAFDEADANLAQRLADAQVDDDRTPEERAADRTPEDPLFVENQGDRTDAEIQESLNSGEPVDPSEGANPAEGEPGDGQDENAEKTEEAQEDAEERQEEANAEMLEQAKQDAAAGFSTDSQAADENADGSSDVRRPEAVLDGTVDEVKAYAAEHPDQISDLLSGEVKGENRTTLVDWLESHKPFNPNEHNVGETKEYFDSADDDEVARVKAIEADGQGRSGIMNWARA